jgi:hypothetical protein
VLGRSGAGSWGAGQSSARAHTKQSARSGAAAPVLGRSGAREQGGLPARGRGGVPAAAELAPAAARAGKVRRVRWRWEPAGRSGDSKERRKAAREKTNECFLS